MFSGRGWVFIWFCSFQHELCITLIEWCLVWAGSVSTAQLGWLHSCTCRCMAKQGLFQNTWLSERCIFSSTSSLNPLVISTEIDGELCSSLFLIKELHIYNNQIWNDGYGWWHILFAMPFIYCLQCQCYVLHIFSLRMWQCPAESACRERWQFRGCGWWVLGLLGSLGDGMGGAGTSQLFIFWNGICCSFYYVCFVALRQSLGLPSLSAGILGSPWKLVVNLGLPASPLTQWQLQSYLSQV